MDWIQLAVLVGQGLLPEMGLQKDPQDLSHKIDEFFHRKPLRLETLSRSILKTAALNSSYGKHLPKDIGSYLGLKSKC